jgi:hypothetical protein
MATNNGEQIFEALLALNYHVEIAEDGKITATKGAQTIRGKAEHGAIEWADSSEVYQVMQLAYVAKLRGRIQEAQAQGRNS